jgi:serine/threonine-protein kinase
MATVHFGRLRGDGGFARAVAVKQLHREYARDPEFAAMMLDEARIAARIAHPNVVQVLDVVAHDNEFFLVMEYVQGSSLSALLRASQREGVWPGPGIAASVLIDALHGLHAAHVACDEKGRPLNVVHRDVSPQNIMVGLDGRGHVLDFGIAKALGRRTATGQGKLKGKIAYMSPEHARGEPLDARSDVYAAAIVLWELLVHRRLFSSDSEIGLLAMVIAGAPLSQLGLPELDSPLGEIVRTGLSHSAEGRYRSAFEMAAALEATGLAAPADEIAAWVRRFAPPVPSGDAAADTISEGDVTFSGDTAEHSPVSRPGLPAIAQPPRSSPIRNRRATATTVQARSREVPATATPSRPQAVTIRSRSVEVPPTAAPSPSVARRLAVGIAAAVLAALAVGGVWSVGRRGTEAPPGRKAAAVAAPLAAEVPSAALDAGPSVVAAVPAPAVDPKPEVPAPAPVRAEPAPREHHEKHVPPKADPCNPPYELDAAGNRVFKRQCLR